MRLRASVCVLTCVLFVPVWAGAQSSSNNSSPPVAPVRPTIDDYYGTKITDPYRYMEDLKNPEVQAWIKAQNQYSRTILSDVPGREKLLERVHELNQSVVRVNARRLPGDLYLLSKRLPGEDVAKLYLRHGLNGEDKLLVDPEKVEVAASSRGKGKNTIQYFDLSPNDKYIGVGIAPGGSE